jgi:hypothetical protein
MVVEDDDMAGEVGGLGVGVGGAVGIEGAALCLAFLLSRRENSSGGYKKQTLHRSN